MSGIYRQNVGIIVCKKGKVLLFARADQKGLQWQFPQGGMEESESVEEAALRELKEETGLSNVRLLCTMPKSVKYDFPKELIKKWKEDNPWKKNNYIGQEQRWVLFEFLGEDSEVNFLTHPEEIEFKAFKWAEISEAVEAVVPFKKEAYEEVAAYFSPFIKEKTNE